MKPARQRHLTMQRLRPHHFARSKVLPAHVRSVLLVQFERWKVKYVVWKRGTKYPDHILKAEAYLFVVKGRLTVRARTIGPGTWVHFTRGFVHRDYGSAPGAEFILIWQGPQTIKFL